MDHAAEGGPDEGERRDRREARDEILESALANGMTYEEAGAFAGCTGRTVARRMADPAFRRRVSLHRAQVVAETTGALVAGSAEAIATIEREMRDAERSPDRLRAAALLLTLALRYRHAFELEVRLHEVEVRVGLAVTSANGDEERDDVDQEST
jgi:hypothetical protein